MAINILLTSVSAKVLLVKEFKRALLAERTQGTIIGIDHDRLSPALYFCDEYRLCPRLDDPGYSLFLKTLCKEKRISLIVPTRNEDVVYLSESKDLLEADSRLRVLAPSPETMRICYDKYEFYRFLSKNGLPLIRSWIKASAAIPFPCIIKPRRGAGAKEFHRIRNKAELTERLRDVEDPLIQEYVEGTEYSIDCFSDFEGRCLSLVPRIRLKVVAGESKVSVTVQDESLIRSAKELAEKLGLIGHNVIQCFKTASGRIKFIEVNPRFGGASNLSFAAGRNSPRFLIQLLRGKKIRIRGFRSNLVMLRYSDDMFLQDDQTRPL
jgi:carbamoyl-phosphate synthase large subunit